MARGDARRALSTLELVADYARDAGGQTHITLDAVTAAESHRPLLYDKSGEEHYNVVSAFIKSMRGSDPDAAVYWMMRMLEAGDDPLFVSRRMLIFASEDVGQRRPARAARGDAADAALRRVGHARGRCTPLAQACLYLASAPKSNACNVALATRQGAHRAAGALAGPEEAAQRGDRCCMKDEGYGEGYKYAHATSTTAVVPGETYLPDELAGTVLYEPSERGEEKAVRERLAKLRAARAPR